ncbi:MAG: hypothetical protein AAB426_03480 [Myxococcota bacterium]
MYKILGVALAAMAITAACSCGTSRTSPKDPLPNEVPGDDPLPDSEPGGDALVTFDVASVTSFEAALALRPGVTADGIDVSAIAGSFGDFLTDNDQRVGRILYDGINHLLSTLPAPPNTSTELTARLASLDQATIGPVIAAGGSVLLNFVCPMPDFLSSRQGYGHDVRSGRNIPSADSVSSCSPPKSDAISRQLWGFIVGAVAEYFGSRYGNHVVYLFGREPENYFVGDLAAFLDMYQLTAEGILTGDAQARIGGVTPVDMADKLTKAQATYDAVGDRFDYVPELLDEPLLKKWIDHSGACSFARHSLIHRA